MDSLAHHVQEYTKQLSQGHIKKAYRGIMTFMSDLKSYLEKKYPEYTTGSLYFGYMDMTYFAFTPSALKNLKLKIAIVYLHEECKFEVWLAGNNRKIQADFIEFLSRKNIGKYTLSTVQPGVDSIIVSTIVETPDFSDLDALKKKIEEKTIKFIKDMFHMGFIAK